MRNIRLIARLDIKAPNLIKGVRLATDAGYVLRQDAGYRMCAAVSKDNITGFQCHPERSGRVGLGIMANFLR